MDYEQLREILVNTEKLYSLWQSTGMSEEEFIRGNGGLIEEYEKARLKKESERQRQKRFFEKQKAQGKKSLTCLVSSETYDTLCRRRDKRIQAGEKVSLGQVLDDIILPGDQPAIVETQPEIQAPASEEKDQVHIDIIGIIRKARNDGLTWAFVADQLNEHGILSPSGKPWTKSNAQIFYSRNK